MDASDGSMVRTVAGAWTRGATIAGSRGLSSTGTASIGNGTRISPGLTEQLWMVASIGETPEGSSGVGT